MTEEEKLRRGAGIAAAVGWAMIAGGVTALLGWPGTIIVLGLFFAIPTRYLRQ